MNNLSRSLGVSALSLALLLGFVSTVSAQSLTDLLGQLTSSAKASGDATLKSLSGDLTSKATSLYDSLKANPAAQNQLVSGVQ